jgi:hypothetical protein
VGPSISHEQAVLGLPRLVDRDDVLMLERGLELCLPLEASPEARIVAQIGGQQLEGDLAVQRQLGGAIDDTHAPSTEHAVDAVPGHDRSPF